MVVVISIGSSDNIVIRPIHGSIIHFNFTSSVLNIAVS